MRIDSYAIVNAGLALLTATALSCGGDPAGSFGGLYLGTRTLSSTVIDQSTSDVTMDVSNAVLRIEGNAVNGAQIIAHFEDGSGVPCYFIFSSDPMTPMALAGSSCAMMDNNMQTLTDPGVDAGSPLVNDQMTTFTVSSGSMSLALNNLSLSLTGSIVGSTTTTDATNTTSARSITGSFTISFTGTKR